MYTWWESDNNVPRYSRRKQTCVSGSRETHSLSYHTELSSQRWRFGLVACVTSQQKLIPGSFRQLSHRTRKFTPGLLPLHSTQLNCRHWLLPQWYYDLSTKATSGVLQTMKPPDPDVHHSAVASVISAAPAQFMVQVGYLYYVLPRVMHTHHRFDRVPLYLLRRDWYTGDHCEKNRTLGQFVFCRVVTDTTEITYQRFVEASDIPQRETVSPLLSVTDTSELNSKRWLFSSLILWHLNTHWRAYYLAGSFGGFNDF